MKAIIVILPFLLASCAVDRNTFMPDKVKFKHTFDSETPWAAELEWELPKLNE